MTKPLLTILLLLTVGAAYLMGYNSYEPSVIVRLKPYPIEHNTVVTKTVTELQNVYIYEEVPTIITKMLYSEREWQGIPFQSRAELQAWLDKHEPLAMSWGGITNPDCEELAIGLWYQMVQEGYIVGLDLNEQENHLWVIVPVFSENRYYFVEGEMLTISDTLNGREWRLD